MIVELAILEARTGEVVGMLEGLTRARAIISRSPGYLSSSLHQSIARERFALYTTWEPIEDHTEGFREGPLFPEWRAQCAVPWRHTGRPPLPDFPGW